LHAPAPLQVDTCVSVLPLQVYAPHGLAVPGYEQAVVVTPSQRRAQSVPTPVPPHEARDVPCGAPFTGVHVPTNPATSHAEHWSVHALLQHTPSTQAFEVHCPPSVQTSPFGFFGTQVEDEHQLTASHCAFAEQDVPQLPFAHRNPEQPARVGGGVPVTLVQVPDVQVTQAPVQAVSQQMPRTQLPVLHAAPPAQTLPFDPRSKISTVESATDCSCPPDTSTRPSEIGALAG